MDIANDVTLPVEIEPLDSTQSSQRSSILYSNEKNSDDPIVLHSMNSDERIEYPPSRSSESVDNRRDEPVSE